MRRGKRIILKIMIAMLMMTTVSAYVFSAPVNGAVYGWEANTAVQEWRAETLHSMPVTEVRYVTDSELRPIGSVIHQSKKYNVLKAAFLQNGISYIHFSSYDEFMDIMYELNREYPGIGKNMSRTNAKDIETAYIDQDRNVVFWDWKNHDRYEECTFRIKPNVAAIDRHFDNTEDLLRAHQMVLNAGIRSGIPQIKAIILIADYLTRNLSYDTSLKNSSWNQAIADRATVCQGYAELFYVMCSICGIDCQLVYGTCNGTPHMWNYVQIGESGFYLDLTAYDGGERPAIRMDKLDARYDIKQMSRYLDWYFELPPDLKQEVYS